MIIIGNGVLYNKMNNYITLHKLKNVTLLNNIKRKDVLKKISQSKIIILTSSHETFGIVLIEGISFGLKVISTDSGGPRDIVNKFNGILLKEKANINELGNAMKKLIDLKMSKKKIIYEYKKKFSEDVMLKNLLHIYKKSLKKTNRTDKKY